MRLDEFYKLSFREFETLYNAKFGNNNALTRDEYEEVLETWNWRGVKRGKA